MTNAPFVGRTEELAAIVAAAGTARAGHPLVVSVEGVAGAGKTALVRRAVAGLGEDSPRRPYGDAGPLSFSSASATSP